MMERVTSANACITRVNSDLLSTRACTGRCCRGRNWLLPYQYGKPRKAKVSPGIVNDIHLARVQAGFELRQRDVKLKNSRPALRRIQLPRLDQRRLKRFYLAVEEHDAGQQMDGVFDCRSLLFRLARWLGRL